MWIHKHGFKLHKNPVLLQMYKPGEIFVLICFVIESAK